MANQHLARGEMLVEQGRFELAEKELHQALAIEPENAQAHSLLGLCFVERKAYAEATQAAEYAVHLAPDEPGTHYILAYVYFARNRYKEAEAAVQQALAQDAGSIDHVSLLSRIYIAQSRWKDALEIAEIGLSIDPEDVDCINCRAIALTRLGRKQEAGEVIGGALAQEPENDETHANMGWTLLEQGEYEKSLHHFREALRLNPESEWARLGIVEALKARNLLYRLPLMYFLWMMKLTQRSQWMFVIGAYVGYRLLLGVARSNPDWSPWITPVLVVYIAFVAMSWLAAPLFNLVLSLNPFGRLALSRGERITAYLVGVCVAGGLSGAVAYIATDHHGPLCLALAFLILIPPISVVHRCSPGKPKTLALLLTIGLAIYGFGVSIPMLFWNVIPPDLLVKMVPTLIAATRGMVFAFIGSQIVSQILVQMQPRH